MTIFRGIRISHFLMVLIAVLLAATTFLFATVPLLVLRNALGANRYLAVVLVAMSPFVALNHYGIWIPFALSALLVALYQQARELDCGLAQAGLVAILGTSGLLAFATGLYVNITEINLVTVLEQQTLAVISSLKQFQPDFTMDVEKVVSQIPSLVMMMLMIALWIGLLGLKFLAKRGSLDGVAGFTQQKIKESLALRLSDFQLPGVLIWLALLVIGLTFVDYNFEEIKVISGNLLNVLIVLYFFHGLSIIAVFFRANEIGIFWQVFWYVILTIHMFLLVSSLGFADYWMDLRSKINKKPAKTA